jgi:hypothetical protein
MKMLLTATVSLIIGAIIGFGFCHTLYWNMSQNDQSEMGIRIARDIETAYGTVSYKDQATYTNVIGTIHVVKDIDLAIYNQNGVKTIRVYE